MNITYKHKYVVHSHEDNIKEYIDRLPSGSIFYDLGANLGWFALYAASIGLETYAFEIDENNFLGLKENVLANQNINNIRIYNQGIADTKKIVNLRTESNVVGAHHKVIDISNFSASKHIRSGNILKPVEVDSLDNIIKNNNLPYPEYLKIDIDGSEYAFLLGSPEVLKYAKSMVIEFYTESEFYNASIAILNQNGFTLQKTYEIPGEKNLYNFVYSKNVE
jgi:FkbM family methyltransferase